METSRAKESRVKQVKFQSTPPRGWRRSGPGPYFLIGDFNPLHREGGDCPLFFPASLSFDFNPLHREGGDNYRLVKGMDDANFNPLHREGGDLQWHPPRHKFGNFNPLHREGGDKTDAQSSASAAISIHSTARVETWQQGGAAWKRTDFNPLHREGGD